MLVNSGRMASQSFLLAGQQYISLAARPAYFDTISPQFYNACAIVISSIVGIYTFDTYLLGLLPRL